MDCFLRSNFQFYDRKFLRVLILGLWAAGLFLGTIISLSAASSLVPIIRSVVIERNYSWFSLLFIRLFPLLLTILVLVSSRLDLLLLLVVLKSFVYSYTSVSVVTAFGSAASLLCILLLFSETITLPILITAWLGAVSEEAYFTSKSCLLAGAIIVAISLLDFTYVAPFLVSLIIL